MARPRKNKEIIKELKEDEAPVETTTEVQAPPSEFDPSIPESKQRWQR